MLGGWGLCLRGVLGDTERKVGLEIGVVWYWDGARVYDHRLGGLMGMGGAWSWIYFNSAMTYYFADGVEASWRSCRVHSNLALISEGSELRIFNKLPPPLPIIRLI